ncbi:MAG TPA: hypothetical protein GX505_10585 [Clostridiales bacterium]|nr:hypothetical protein [Clostridiales bacterium]
MGINNGIHHVVRFKNGDIWHFSSLTDRGISYRRLNQNGTWGEPVDLIPNTDEDFSVSIDQQDHLHLICRTVKGELLYMFYNGNNWASQTLSRYEPIRYVIRYPVIIPLKNKIHILFAIGTTFNTGYWSLYHYYWDETTWHSTEITRLTAGYRLSPFYLDLSEKHIHLVFRGLSSNKYQVFYCRYHLDHGIWSTPENVTHSASDCNMPSILIRDDILHLAWTSLTKNDLTVKYKNKHVRNFNKVEWSSEIQLSVPGSNASFPRLVWVEGRLWCIWCQTDTLYGCHSDDQGATWTPPAALPGQYGPNFHYINYSTNHPREREVFQLQWILGSLDQGLYIPVAGEYMDLPKYNPSLSVAGWETETKDEPAVQKPQIKEMTKPAKEKGTPEEEFLKPKESTVKHNTERLSGYAPSLENILLNEFDRQEEFNYTVISRLDEQSKLNDSILQESRQILEQLKETSKMLQVLKKEVEQVKQDVTELKSRGLLNRIFNKN